MRREALERLWDAWERLKSFADPADKKLSVKIILDAAAAEPLLRARLEEEAKELTAIGNSHLIGHSEVNQLPVIDVDQVDYQFHRLFAMIQLLLKKGNCVSGIAVSEPLAVEMQMGSCLWACNPHRPM